VRPGGGYEPRHDSPMARDLDFLSGLDVIEHRENASLRLGGGHPYGHMAILMVTNHERYVERISVRAG
jgi:hypothetical protein